MPIIKHRAVFFALTAVLASAALVSTIVFGLKLSIDFTGGTLVEVSYKDGRPPVSVLQNSLKGADIKDYSLREAGQNEYILRAGNMTPEDRQTLPQTLSIGGKFSATIVQLSEIGPTIGAELRSKAFLSIGLVMLCILLFIAFAFRKVSRPISSWVYGGVALVTLVHDIIIPVGFFAILGHFTGAAVDTLFVTALLTVLGFSIHDTIVVFDRTRENLSKHYSFDFSQVVNDSINQTLIRSINTSVTILLVLITLYIFGGSTISNFVLALIVGIIIGTYSSIFVASTLIVSWHNWSKRLKKKP